jgi:hypothetical protein
MIQKLFISFLILVTVMLSQQQIPLVPHLVEQVYSSNERLLAKHQMSLETRYANKTTNEVFKDNILLTLAYMSGRVHNASEINWDKVRESSRYEVVLQPGEVFAYHDDVLAEYKGKSIVTTRSRFGAQQGFRSSGYLYGDGVCHLASLITWTARDAGLKVVAPTSHDFANIPEVPKVHGTSIVTTGSPSLNAQRQNLYVENTLDEPVRIVFEYANSNMSVAVYK